MTKLVRIENADLGAHKLVVQTWVKGSNGEPDRKIGEEALNNPTDMCNGMVWAEQYLVVKEAE
ncbi:MAG: hypothetical protein CMJ58_12830 [Planctomycetaceae bacterium]|nr:hypothetical protein [Planctomycetaceae bacterium]